MLMPGTYGAGLLPGLNQLVAFGPICLPQCPRCQIWKYVLQLDSAAFSWANSDKAEETAGWGQELKSETSSNISNLGGKDLLRQKGASGNHHQLFKRPRSLLGSSGVRDYIYNSILNCI